MAAAAHEAAVEAAPGEAGAAAGGRAGRTSMASMPVAGVCGAETPSGLLETPDGGTPRVTAQFGHVAADDYAKFHTRVVLHHHPPITPFWNS